MGRGGTKPTQPGTALLADPDFQYWLRDHRIRDPEFGQLNELMYRYLYEQREEEQRIEEKAQRERRERAAQTRNVHAVEEDTELKARIAAGWKSPVVPQRAFAREDVAAQRQVTIRYFKTHFDSDADRWAYARAYYQEAHETANEPYSEEILLNEVLSLEKQWIAREERTKQETQDKLRPDRQLKELKKWATKQAMDLDAELEPGIAFYDVSEASLRPQWVAMEVVGLETDKSGQTISYATGHPLRISRRVMQFDELTSVRNIVVRRHKKTGRLIPCVIFEASHEVYADLPDIDTVSLKDRALLAIPRFDPMLTPALTDILSHENALLKVAGGLTTITTMWGIGKLNRPTAGVLAGGIQRVTSGFTAVRGTAGAVAKIIGTEIRLAVTSHGVSGAAALQLRRATYSFYLSNAVAVNSAVLVATEVTLSFATGADMGPLSVDDTVVMAAKLESRVANFDVPMVPGMNGVWHRVEVEITAVDNAAGIAYGNRRAVAEISEDVARTELNFGKTVIGTGPGALKQTRAVDDTATAAKLAGRPRVKRVPLARDPRPVLPINELEDAMRTLQPKLARLTKYDPAALQKIATLSADAIRESGIRPSDLAKLGDSLARAGQNVQNFINRFHDVPGFERVILGWAKRSYWTGSRWKTTESFRRGTGFVMKYCNAKLSPADVRFEWPVGLKKTSWGGEIFARHVDIVVTGGVGVKPGQTINVELKSWTRDVLRQKARQTRGGLAGQLWKDVALGPISDLRWVFDGTKTTREDVLDVFERVISEDEYLKKAFGGADSATLREVLGRVIEVF
jgi:hypothetical protein